MESSRINLPVLEELVLQESEPNNPELLLMPVLGNVYLTGLFSGIRNSPYLIWASLSVNFSRWIAAFSGRWGKETQPLKTIEKCSVVESRDGEVGRDGPLRVNNKCLSVDSRWLCRAFWQSPAILCVCVTAETSAVSIWAICHRKSFIFSNSKDLGFSLF